MSDSDKSANKQTHFKNLEGVHFTVHTSRESLHKVSSTATLKRHIPNKSLIANENALLDHKTPFRPSQLVNMKSRSSIRSTNSVKSTQSNKQTQNLSTIEYDQKCRILPLRKFHDECDILSRHPSFTIKNISYSLECHQRYQKAWAKYNAQFRKEMGKYISLKRVADQYRTRCFLSYSTFWPPLHTKRELEIFNRQFLKLNAEEQKRLNLLMTTELSYA